MEALIIILCLIYVAIAYIIDRGTIGEWAQDATGELDEIPDWFVRFTIFILALFWIVSIPLIMGIHWLRSKAT